MAESVASFDAISRTARSVGPRAWMLLPVAAACVLAAIWVGNARIALVLASVAATLAVLAALLLVPAGCSAAAAQRLARSVARVAAEDPVPTLATDADGRVLYHNRAAEDRFDAADAPSLFRAFETLLADPREALQRLQRRAAHNGSAHRDIATRRSRVRVTVHRVGKNQFLWRCEDLAAATATNVVETSETPILWVDENDAIESLNAAAHDLLGMRPGLLREVVPDLPSASDCGQRVLTEDGPIEARVVELAADAKRREVFLLPESTVPAALDMPLLEALPVALLQLSAEGRLLTANRQARALLSEPSYAGLALSDLVAGLGRSVDDWVRDAIAGRAVNRPEVVRATRAEQETYLQITLARLSETSEARLVAVLHDATELKTLEAQFVQSQKMQAIGQLAGGVAHDFNNLLTAISGHCDLLLLRHDEGDPDFADLDQIRQNANRAASLVRQLLAFSRKQSLSPEPLDLGEVLSELTHLLNRLVGEPITLSVNHDPAISAIRADKRQLEQVMMNLVVNARDAMPEGGEIRIETEGRYLTEEMHWDRAIVPPGDYVVVKISDSGIGIAHDKLAKIFEPFFTTKRSGEGTGLGLSTVYGIVKQTGGFIFADSIKGEGTCFSLFFPAHLGEAPAGAAEESAPPPAAVRGGEGAVMLVEDEPPVRAFAARALRLRGYSVLEAASAEEALETLEDETIQVDVFVTDVIMPGMDGPDWVRQALQRRPETRVIFVSGYAEESFSQMRKEIPNSAFLPKPFSLNDLTTLVGRQLA